MFTEKAGGATELVKSSRELTGNEKVKNSTAPSRSARFNCSTGESNFLQMVTELTDK